MANLGHGARVDTVGGTHDNRLVEVADIDALSEVPDGALVDNVTSLLPTLVLSVDSILGLFNISVTEFIEIVVFVVLLVLFAIFLSHEEKGGVVNPRLLVLVALTFHVVVGALNLNLAGPDLVLVQLVNLPDFFIHDLIISGLSILGLFLDLFELALQVSPLDSVLGAAVVAALPFADVNGSEDYAEGNKTGQVKREIDEVAIVCVSVDIVWTFTATSSHFNDQDVVAKVESEPDEHKVGAEDFIVGL